MKEDVGLAEAIAAVRRELLVAQQHSDDDLTLKVGQVTIELAVSVQKTAGAKASVKVLDLLSIGGKGERTTAGTNTITVELTPAGRDGADFAVGSKRAQRPGG